ncbi:hypothetical protein ACJZ2D_003391 [Fusarium nematophilum]
MSKADDSNELPYLESIVQLSTPEKQPKVSEVLLSEIERFTRRCDPRDLAERTEELSRSARLFYKDSVRRKRDRRRMRAIKTAMLLCVAGSVYWIGKKMGWF